MFHNVFVYFKILVLRIWQIYLNTSGVLDGRHVFDQCY